MFIKPIITEIQRKKCLAVYKNAISEYTNNLERLNHMKASAEAMGKPASRLKEEIDKAIKQCEDSIHRFEIVVSSLQERDYRYIQDQMQFTRDLTDACEKSAVNISIQLQELRKQCTPAYGLQGG